jgi:hypothetical protein
MNVCLKRLIICEFIALTEHSASAGFVGGFAVFLSLNSSASQNSYSKKNGLFASV